MVLDRIADTVQLSGAVCAVHPGATQLPGPELLIAGIQNSAWPIALGELFLTPVRHPLIFQICHSVEKHLPAAFYALLTKILPHTVVMPDMCSEPLSGIQVRPMGKARHHLCPLPVAKLVRKLVLGL